MGLTVKKAEPKQPEAKNKKQPQQASDTVLAALKKEFGEHIGSRGGAFLSPTRVPTGFFPLDLALGGGFPRKRVSQIYGTESSGKSLVTYKTIASIQRTGQTAVLVVLENDFVTGWARRLGVDTDRLIVLHPDNAEQAVDAVQSMLHAEDVGLVALDALADMITQKSLDKDASQGSYGGASIIIADMFRKIGSTLQQRSKVCEKGTEPMFLYVNQIRIKIGTMFGDPETTPGGNILKFTDSIKLRLYGKKEIDKSVDENHPARLHVSGVIKKWKVPIGGSSFEYDVALLPHDGLNVGEVNAWNTVSNRLKGLGSLENTGKGWTALGQTYKTLDELKKLYLDDAELRHKLHQHIFDKTRMLNAE